MPVIMIRMLSWDLVLVYMVLVLIMMLMSVVGCGCISVGNPVKQANEHGLEQRR